MNRGIQRNRERLHRLLRVVGVTDLIRPCHIPDESLIDALTSAACDPVVETAITRADCFDSQTRAGTYDQAPQPDTLIAPRRCRTTPPTTRGPKRSKIDVHVVLNELFGSSDGQSTQSRGDSSPRSDRSRDRQQSTDSSKAVSHSSSDESRGKEVQIQRQSSICPFLK